MCEFIDEGSLGIPLKGPAPHEQFEDATSRGIMTRITGSINR